MVMPFRQKIGRSRTTAALNLMLVLALVLSWASVAQAQTRNDILFTMEFEGSYSPMRPDGNSRISIVNSPVRSGTRAALIELSTSDPVNYRTELTSQSQHTFRLGQEYWVGMSIYLPSDWVKDYSTEIVMQIHSWPDKDLGEDWRNPPIALYVNGDQWQMRLRTDSKALTKMGQYELDKTFGNLGTIKRGGWTDWVFHIKYNYDSTGLLEAWADGKKVVDHKGPVTQNDKDGGFLKFGIYKWDWKGGATATSKRALYFDAFRIGGAGSDYASVAPSGTTPGGETPKPTPTPTPSEDANQTPSTSLLLLTRPFSIEEMFEPQASDDMALFETRASDESEPHEQSPTREYSSAEVQAPILTSPVGASNKAAPVLTWRGVEGATGYYYSVKGPQGLVHDMEYIPSDGNCVNGQCKVSLPVDLDDGTYTWWVASTDDYATSGPSRALSFSVDRAAPPTVPVAIAPEGGIANKATEMVWSAVEGAEEYELRISGKGGVVFETRLTAEAEGGQCSLPVMELGKGTYRWMVRAVGASGNSAWSKPMRFTLAPGAARPQPLEPQIVARQASPVLTWAHLPKASTYVVEVRDDSGVIFLRVVRASDVMQGGICSVQGPLLENGKQYLWRVRNQRNGVWSESSRLQLGQSTKQ
ncbi:Polysaccharide lyase [Desulfocurvibacter africanus PCS]|uniref:Polysaccharide lyase n=1 Tax=Desulfocurvibacter africanus PCS TaxID=1262666 RepID=M5PTV5_DESAF|nr:polysaccharide lyase [Desulfocurvibacter africanus]EMG37782.1 Polysaccharide lyase [Desulfocurvibacter africanus PCS]